jgi:hypothetical protein
MWQRASGFVLWMARELTNRGDILDIVRIGVGPDSEVLRNPPEEDLGWISCDSPRLACT